MEYEDEDELKIVDIKPITNNEMINQHLNGFITNAKKYDMKLGLNYNPHTKQLYIGNQIAQIDNNSIIIKQIRFPLTTGLCELLFFKKTYELYGR